MPEILPVVPAMPAAPAPVAGVAPAAPVGDGSPADFMGQLAAALKGLKGLATAVKALPGQPVVQPALQPVDAKLADADQSTADSDKPITPSDDVTELMATLGLVLVPAQQLQTLHADSPAASARSVAAQQPLAALPQMPRQVAEKRAADTDAAPQEAVKLPKTPIAPELAKHVAANAAEASAPKATSDAPAPDAQQPTTSVVAQPVTQQAPAPHAATPNVPPQAQHEGGAFQQSTGGHEPHRDGTKSSSVIEVEPVRTEPVAQPTFTDATLTTTAPVETAAPATPQAVDVAAQIAHQVDLYRLPGSKGVRIQLHPEDLGGVQVTVRYGTGGSLELHVSVEHAATGSLVQAGLDHLRDALATHGFEPDRIVMSVTAPSSANQMDFNANSNGNASYRSDPGMAAFTQDGQSGHQRSDQDDARGARGWSSASDSDDSPRAASQASSGTSVIDYRV